MGDHGEPAGAAAEAIHAAERSLARQNSAAAQVDLHVITAILNAHTARADGAGALTRLQSDVESALASRTDLDTPAGARAFQRYLLSRLHDIRSVVETAELDATSKATLSAALATLYASATPAEATGDSRESATPVDAPVDLGFDAPASEPSDAAPTAASTTPAAAAPPSPMPAWTGAPSGAGTLPSLGSLGGLGSPVGWGSLDRLRDTPDRPRDGVPGDTDPDAKDPAAKDPAAKDPADGAPSDAAQPAPDVHNGVSPELAAVITAAVAGTPIPEAFARQGIAIPPAGSAVTNPVDPAYLAAGDVGVLTDGHALALGNGKALLENSIQPISAVDTRGLLGWLRPVKPEPKAPVPVTATPTA